MEHGPLFLDFNVYGPDAERMSIDQHWPVKINARDRRGDLMDEDAGNPDPVCPDCENCRWDPEKDCGLDEHAHCDRCDHCVGRHGPWMTSRYVDARTIHHTMPRSS